MKIGTKSVLFGAHAFYLHPWFVAWAWWKLYGFPWKPWLWVMFFVHDLGYWGKPNMDGPEGEEHPWLGARFLYRLQALWILLKQPVFFRKRYALCTDIRWWQLRRRWAHAYLGIKWEEETWGNVSLYHSRFLCKQYGARPSMLCIADKLAICLTPYWLYLPMARATREIHEYRALGKDESATNKYASMNVWSADEKQWYLNVQGYLRKYVEEHRDGREDTWTPQSRQPRDDLGVWS